MLFAWYAIKILFHEVIFIIYSHANFCLQICILILFSLRQEVLLPWFLTSRSRWHYCCQWYREGEIRNWNDCFDILQNSKRFSFLSHSIFNLPTLKKPFLLLSRTIPPLWRNSDLTDKSWENYIENAHQVANFHLDFLFEFFFQIELFNCRAWRGPV